MRLLLPMIGSSEARLHLACEHASELPGWMLRPHNRIVQVAWQALALALAFRQRGADGGADPLLSASAPPKIFKCRVTEPNRASLARSSTSQPAAS